MKDFNWTEWTCFLVVAAVLVYFIFFEGRWQWPPPWRLK